MEDDLSVNIFELYQRTLKAYKSVYPAYHYLHDHHYGVDLDTLKIKLLGNVHDTIPGLVPETCTVTIAEFNRFKKDKRNLEGHPYVQMEGKRKIMLDRITGMMENGGKSLPEPFGNPHQKHLLSLSLAYHRKVLTKQEEEKSQKTKQEEEKSQKNVTKRKL